MSLTLATTDTITGVAGSATSITYTIFGDEVSAGADAFKVLAQGQLPASVGTLYTVPASTMAIVKAIHLVNGTAGTVTARINVKGTAAANAILPAISILAGGFAVYADDGWKVYNDQGQVLGVGATGATGAAGATGDTGATGAAGANGLATSGTPAVVLSTTAAAGGAATALATDAQIIAFDVTVPSTQAFGDAAATGAAAVTARRDHKHAMMASPLGLPLGLTGAVDATRYVGGTASVAPTTGTFAVGDFVITQAGSVYICTVAGSPGTWVAVSGGGGAVATDAIWDAAGDTAVGTGANTAVKRKNNDGAAAAPTVNDDSGDGYAIGSRWLDTTNDKEYVALDVTAAAAVWVETTGGGSGGATWTQVVNEDGSSFANFTAATGTWASAGGKITQTDAAANWRRAKFNTKLAFGFPWIMEADLFVVSTAGDTRVGLGISDGTNLGGLSVVLRVGTGVVVDRDSVGTIRTFTATIAHSTTYKLRLVMGSGWLSVYLDGTLLGSVPLMASSGWDALADFMTLFSYSASVTIDNVKAWVLSGSAPA